MCNAPPSRTPCRLAGFKDALRLHRCVVFFVHDPRILVSGGGGGGGCTAGASPHCIAGQ